MADNAVREYKTINRGRLTPLPDTRQPENSPWFKVAKNTRGMLSVPESDRKVKSQSRHVNGVI